MERITAWKTGMRWVLGRGLIEFVVHLVTNGHMAFHRDELATLDDGAPSGLGLCGLSTPLRRPWPGWR